MTHHPWDELRDPHYSKPKASGLAVIAGLALASLVAVLFALAS